MHWLTTSVTTATTDLANRLISELSKGRQVLWLISGGSNIATARDVLAAIPDELTAKLTIMPVDERYGEPGHIHSNWQQFLTSVIDTKQAALLPALQPDQTFEAAGEYFESVAKQAFEQADVSIGLLGIGSDGHIAGILPHSPATQETENFVIAYKSEPYQRLTVTFTALKKLTAAYVLAYGEAKREPLLRLQTEDLPLDEQPAQILKQLSDVCLYNDQVEEKS